MKIGSLATACVAILASGCVHQPGAADGPATAVLRDSGGREVAQANLVHRSTGVRLFLQARGMKPGTFGAHVHAVGRCDPPDFASAGPHWNPTGRQHGKDNPAGMHKGDLPNLVVGGDGRARLVVTLDGARLADLLDADGAAVVIHAAADDYRTDPSGNSGARVACGVLVPS